jgi:acyl carrier protein
MTENRTAPTLPEVSEIVDALRAGLVQLLPLEDLAQVDVHRIDAQTQLLSLPVDSAVLMALMNHLEDTFGVYIDEEAAFSFAVIGEVADYIRQRLGAKARRLENS